MHAGDGVPHIATGICGVGVECALEAVGTICASVTVITSRSGGAIHVEPRDFRIGIATVLGSNRGHAEQGDVHVCRAVLAEGDGGVGRAFQQGDDGRGHIDHREKLRAALHGDISAVVHRYGVECPRDFISTVAVLTSVDGIAVLDRVAQGRSSITVVRADDLHFATLGRVKFTHALAVEFDHHISGAVDLDGRSDRIDEQHELVCT